MPVDIPRGRFVWHELLTTDPDAAARFYPKVMGWKVVPYDKDPSYRIWMAGKSGLGGLMKLPEDARRMGAPSHWMPYVAVPDTDEAVRHAQTLGARVLVGPTTIPAGRFAVLADPQGASFSVFTSATADDSATGAFTWHELATTDGKAAWEFYRALFGWEQESSMDMGGMGAYLMYKRAGEKNALGGIYTKPPEMTAPPAWLCYVSVKNADATAKLVKDAGGGLMREPMDVPGGGRIAVCVDPQGAVFAVHAMAAAPKPRAKAKPKAKPKAKAKQPKAKAKARKRPATRKPARKPKRKPARRAARSARRPRRR